MNDIATRTIKKVDKITLLSKLIDNAGFNFDRVQNIKKAIDLAKVIDELILKRISSEMLDIDANYFLAEHWRQRICFLKIVLKHWEKILQEASMKDIPIFQLIEFQEDASQKTKPKKVFEAKNIFEEIEIVNTFVKENKKEKIYIFCPNNTLLKLIRIRLMPDLYLNKTFQIPKDLMEIIDMETEDYIHHNITLTKQIPRQSTDLLIISGMNENNNLGEQNAYWMHSSIRKQLGLNVVPEKVIFQHLLSCASEVFITFSSKINGLNTKKSNLITEFIPTTTQYIQTPMPKQKNKKHPDITLNFEVERVSAKSIELFVENNYDFYVKSAMELHPFSYNNEKRELRFSYKNLVSNFLNARRDELEKTLENIAEVDFYKFQHCKNILSYLENNYGFLKSQNNPNLTYEYDFQINSEKKIKIYTNIDAMLGQKLYFFRMFMPRLKAGDIINGNAIEPLVSSLIVQKNLGLTSVRWLEILDMHGVGRDPIDVLSIEISDKTIELFEERLRKMMSKHIIDGIGTTEKYKHFKRVE